MKNSKLLPIIYTVLFSLCLFNIPSVPKNVIFITLSTILFCAVAKSAKTHPGLTKKQKSCALIAKLMTAILGIMLGASLVILLLTGKTFLIASNFVTIGMEIISISAALLANLYFDSKSLNYILYAVYINYAVVVVSYVITTLLHLDVSTGFWKLIVAYGLETHELAFVAGVLFAYLLSHYSRKDKAHLIILAVILVLCLKRISVFAFIIITAILFLRHKTHIEPKKIVYLNKIINYTIVFGFLIFMLFFFDEAIHFLTKNLGINMNWRDQFYGYILTMPSPFAPLLGAGLRSTDYYLSLNPKIGFISSIHSDILRIYLENGLVLFCIYFIVLTSVISRIIKRTTSSVDSELRYQILLTYTFVCFTTDNLFTYYKYIFVLFVIIFDIMTQRSRKAKGGVTQKSRKKSILIIDHCVDVVGGVERILCALSNHLSKDYDVSVLSENKFVEQSFFKYNQKVKKYYLIDRTRSVFHGRGGRNRVMYILEKIENRLSRIGEAERMIDFLNEHPTPDVIIFGRIFTALRFLPALQNYYGEGIPKIIVRDAIHLYDLKDREKQRMLGTFPGVVSDLIVSSDESAKAYQKFFGDTKIHIVKIYNPLAIKPATVWEGYDRRTITAIGRIDDMQKGFDTLVRAFQIVVKEYPDWRLEIYGSGSAGSAVNTFITENNVPNVSIKPYTKNVVNVLRKTSIFAFPSRYEGYANALVEALSCGIPAVTFDWYMGADEIIKDGKNGVIVKLHNRTKYYHGNVNDQDVRNFASALCNFIAHEETAKQYSKEAVKIRKSRDAAKIFAQWEKLINAKR